MTSVRGAKISDKQKKIFVENVKQLPSLVSGKFSASFTQKDAEREWKKISNTLNSMGGAEKEWKMWRKIWEDLRSRTKTKISGNKLKANKTGGGSSQEEQLSNIEEDILDIIKTVSVEGHNVEESTTAFDFGEEMDITERPALSVDQKEPFDSSYVFKITSSTRARDTIVNITYLHMLDKLDF
ncbi:hypothetical protein MTP99_003442 [Tenebrio molitor]|nr:hypothetical protein MTP99_003442 [Tenebrio molitor]